MHMSRTWTLTEISHVCVRRRRRWCGQEQVEVPDAGAAAGETRRKAVLAADKGPPGAGGGQTCACQMSVIQKGHGGPGQLPGPAPRSLCRLSSPPAPRVPRCTPMVQAGEGDLAPTSISPPKDLRGAFCFQPPHRQCIWQRSWQHTVYSKTMHMVQIFACPNSACKQSRSCIQRRSLSARCFLCLRTDRGHCMPVRLLKQPWAVHSSHPCTALAGDCRSCTRACAAGPQGG